MNANHANVTATKPAINVTPLIDVLLVLIIIFMVIAPRREAHLPVKAPQPANGGDPPSVEMLMLIVSTDYQLALNTKPVGHEELGFILKDLMEQRTAEARVLFIKAPGILPYDSAVALIDTAKGAGTLTIGLLSD